MLALGARILIVVEYITLYMSVSNCLPRDLMRSLLLPDLPVVTVTEDGSSYAYRIGGVDVVCTVMADDLIAEHLHGFVDYVETISRAYSPRVHDLCGEIMGVKTVLLIKMKQGRDEGGECDGLIASLREKFDPILFFENGVYDGGFDLLVGPKGKGRLVGEVQVVKGLWSRLKGRVFGG